MLGMVESGSECWARETEIACNVTEVCPLALPKTEIAGNRSVPKCASVTVCPSVPV